MNIDDDVLQAATHGRTLGELVTQPLRERLSRRPATDRERCEAVTFGDDGPSPGVDITNNAGVRGLMEEL